MKILFFTDVHLVGKSNINRKDNLVETQIDKLQELVVESEKVDLVISCGDIFHKYDPSISTMMTFSNFVSQLKSYFVLCPGNHDLHGYNYDSIEKTGLGYVSHFFSDKIKLLKDDNEIFNFEDLTIHFKRTIDKKPIDEFIVERKTKHHIGLIHDMVFHQDFFGTAVEYKNFDTNLDVVFNGHIHHGHDPIFLNNTWFINTGSVSRMHKPNPYFDVRYAIVDLGTEITIDQKAFKASKEDVFVIHDKKEFTSFIDKIESQTIETNAIEYMFNNANKDLSNDALQLLKTIYEKVV